MAGARRPNAARGRFGLGTRLGTSFGAILAVIAFALVVVLHSLAQMAEADREVITVDRAKHAGHHVAALVREQYIHQAHTIIEGNRSHLDHYRDIAKTTRTTSENLASLARTPRERALALEIALLVRKNHDDFMAETLPAIDRGEKDMVVRLHAETELVVGRVGKLVKELNTELEGRADVALAHAETQRQRVKLVTIGAFGVATLLAALLSIMTMRSIAPRLAALREGARRLGDGDLSQRIALAGDDELTDLARSFDDMAKRLDAHQKALVQSQKLASLGRLCAGVAHEINGPLGIILGYAKVIRKQGADDEALRAIEDEAKQCQRIVQALLDMSRRERPRFEPVDLVQLAREGVERLRATGALGDREVRVEVPPGDLRAFGDEAKLRQVVLNLMTNAIEATPAGGAIEVGVERRRDRVVLSVVDHGPGLPDETREHLFEPFYTTKPRGTGLGLPIARAIVEAHRGEIRLESPESGGVRVEVDLEEARQDASVMFA